MSEITFSNKPFKPSDNLKQVPVIGSDEWEEMLERVKQVLAPKNKGQGVSVVFNYQELVLYRDRDDRIYLKKFRDIPSYINVTGLLKEDQVAAEIIKLLEKKAAPRSINHAQYLYRTGNNYHGSVVFVFIDVKRRQSVFLVTPFHPEYQYDEGITPVIYMARWFYRSAIITCLKNPFTTIYRLYCRVRHSLAVILTGSEHLTILPC